MSVSTRKELNEYIKLKCKFDEVLSITEFINYWQIIAVMYGTQSIFRIPKN